MTRKLLTRRRYNQEKLEKIDKDKVSKLWNKTNYLDKEVGMLTNNRIYEFDMKSGGFSILCKYGKLTPDEIEYLSKVNKLTRNIYIGNKIKNDPSLKNVIEEGFKEARKLFFQYNGIEDKDVLSIKKDAIFILNKRLRHLEFDGYKFELKNIYTSYYYLNNIEFYYNITKNILDIKGLKEDVTDNNLFVQHLIRLFKIAEKGDLFKALKQYRMSYLNKELDIEAYRELNFDNSFRLKRQLFGEILFSEVENDINEIDISYNYTKFILPLIQNII